VILFFQRAAAMACAREPSPTVKRIFVNPKIELTSVIQALKVAEHRSFRRGAEALGVCQSSVSKRVM